MSLPLPLPLSLLELDWCPDEELSLADLELSSLLLLLLDVEVEDEFAAFASLDSLLLESSLSLLEDDEEVDVPGFLGGSLEEDLVDVEVLPDVPFVDLDVSLLPDLVDEEFLVEPLSLEVGSLLELLSLLEPPLSLEVVSLLELLLLLLSLLEPPLSLEEGLLDAPLLLEDPLVGVESSFLEEGFDDVLVEVLEVDEVLLLLGFVELVPPFLVVLLLLLEVVAGF